MVNIPAWQWYALRTPLYREFKAMEALQDRGFAVAVAYEMKHRRKHRRAKSGFYIPEAKFSRYIFGGFPDETMMWRALGDREVAPLIDGPVSVTGDGRPSLIRPAEIVRMHVAYGDRMFIVPRKTEAPDDDIDVPTLKVGDSARIGRWLKRHGEEEFDVGAFVGHVVTIEEIRGPIAKTVMSWFGAQHEVLVPLERLAAA